MKTLILLWVLFVGACNYHEQDPPEPKEYKGPSSTFGFFDSRGALTHCVEFYPDEGHTLDEFEPFFEALAWTKGVTPFPGPCHVVVTGFAPDSVCLDAQMRPEDFPGMLAASYQYLVTPQDQEKCESSGGFYKEVR